MDGQAVSDWRSEVQRHRATLLNYILLAGTALGFIAILVLYLVGLGERGWNPLERGDLLPFVGGWVVVSIAWLLRGLSYRIRAGIMLLLVYLFGSYLLLMDGLTGGGRIWLVLLPALAFVLLGEWPGFVFGGISILTFAFFAFTSSSVPHWLTEAPDFLIGVVGLAMVMWAFNRGWVEALTQAGAANRQLQAQTDALEETTKQLRATAAVAHACSSILDPELLSVEVVNQIQKEFSGLDVYYAGLFLLDGADIDTESQFATLKAATGSIGHQLLERGYRLSLDGSSAISQCIARQRPVVISGEEEATLVADSPLQRARSEAALPLYSRERILGALSVQSSRDDVFDDDIVAVLAAMAGQVAVAFDNARLFTQTGAALREVQAAQRRYLTEAWKEFLSIRPVTRFDYTQPGVKLDDGGGKLLRDARRAVMLHERAVAIDSTPPDSESEAVSSQAVLAVPLKLRGQVVGTLSLHETRRRSWSAEEIAMAETIAEQVALTVENLRLMDEARRRALREQLIGEVSGRIRETLDVDTVLQMAAREIHRALGLRDVTIQLEADIDRTVQ